MLRDLDIKLVYSTGEIEPMELFLDALPESCYFDLALGFFSSTGVQSLALGFAFFIKNGGKMRVIINNTLSSQDKNSILKGQNTLGSVDTNYEQELVSDVRRLAKTLSKNDKHFFNCLSYLIKSGRIEFKAIIPAEHSIGIAHHKFGIFGDKEENKISFTGSLNFSRQAIVNNIESISCFKSWINETSEKQRLEYYSELFLKIWEGRSSVTKEIPISEVHEEILNSFPIETIDDLINEEIEIAEGELNNGKLSASLKHKIRALIDKLKNDHGPSFPDNKEPWEYQVEALNKWEKAGRVGFFQMATGTGKTITSLNCALKLYQSERKIQALILVPTISLADQWFAEIESFNFGNIIIANSKNPNWLEDVIEQINKSVLTNSCSFIITTYSTFSLSRFQAVINRLPESTLLIADEAHNIGSKRIKEILPYKFSRRIGLSATPNRFYDEEGTAAILSFFNALENPTYEFSMAEAIEKGFLCKYYYYPKPVNLTDSELKDYILISKKLVKFFNSKNSNFTNNSIVTALLLKRRRIIHKATNKLSVFRECLDQILEVKRKIQYTLVYVPEGKSSTLDEEDKFLINEYSNVLSNEYGIKQHQFIGLTKDRELILKQFSKGNIQVLTAMKCLDEGIDVKRTETAVFCASTSNPRQFIQRRGRILRKHPDKKIAYIYDMVVIPDVFEKNFKESIQMERTILQNELNRVREFASMAENKWQSLQSLEEIASKYDLDIYSY